MTDIDFGALSVMETGALIALETLPCSSSASDFTHPTAGKNSAVVNNANSDNRQKGARPADVCTFVMTRLPEMWGKESRPFESFIRPRQASQENMLAQSKCHTLALRVCWFTHSCRQ